MTSYQRQIREELEAEQARTQARREAEKLLRQELARRGGGS